MGTIALVVIDLPLQALGKRTRAALAEKRARRASSSGVPASDSSRRAGRDREVLERVVRVSDKMRLVW